jgi:hypothetical protein
VVLLALPQGATHRQQASEYIRSLRKSESFPDHDNIHPQNSGTADTI